MRLFDEGNHGEYWMSNQGSASGHRESYDFLSTSFVSMLINTSQGILRTIVLLSLFILAPIVASAATYYVAPNGNDANPGTQAAPWRTVARAEGYAVNPGDTAIFLDGTYETPSIYLDRSGTASQPITFKAQNKWGAIISSTSGCTYGFGNTRELHHDPGFSFLCLAE